MRFGTRYWLELKGGLIAKFGLHDSGAGAVNKENYLSLWPIVLDFGRFETWLIDQVQLVLGAWRTVISRDHCTVMVST